MKRISWPHRRRLLLGRCVPSAVHKHKRPGRNSRLQTSAGDIDRALINNTEFSRFGAMMGIRAMEVNITAN